MRCALFARALPPMLTGASHNWVRTLSSPSQRRGRYVFGLSKVIKDCLSIEEVEHESPPIPHPNPNPNSSPSIRTAQVEDQSHEAFQRLEQSKDKIISRKVDKIEDLEEELRDRTARLEHEVAKTAAAEKALEGCEKQIITKDQEIERLAKTSSEMVQKKEEDLAMLRKQLREQDVAVAGESETLAETQKQLEQAEKQVCLYEAELQSRANELSKRDIESQKAAHDLKSLQEERDRLQGQLVAMRDKLEMAEDELKGFKREHEAVLHSMHKSLAEVQAVTRHKTMVSKWQKAARKSREDELVHLGNRKLLQGVQELQVARLTSGPWTRMASSTRSLCDHHLPA